MRLAILTEALQGKILGNTVYNENGILFLKEGAVLTSSAIKRLQNMGINTVYIKEDEENDDMVIQEALEIQVKLKLIKLLKEVFNDVKTKNYVDYDKCYEIVDTIIKSINLSENAMLINNLTKSDFISDLCIHSIDVATLSIIIGTYKKYDIKKIINLALAALLHDVGKLLDNNKEHHAILGYNLLKQNTMFKATTFSAVYQHHEMYDGSGPLGLKGENIFEFAKIINISDLYVNLIKQDNILPHEAIERITALGNKIDPEIYRDFISTVYCYPNGTRVILNNGQEGVVIAQNKNLTTRPIVRVKENGKYNYYNLQKELTLFIEKVIL
ncbi:HD-GYP domain, c-di-GMP phosphodiesterase class II (or its inactivated variant) [Caloramator fervidus]|uniref:HD-GYP domain, c-di-GMP phosphodiesterase class II (Or its inactivated variant) n=1 Tax=Caloramator fervidus TaxID=29344 RepID=A0A1H5WQE1_9CLOT|nr:HD domain-containing protein [Caloramator fervidus]SEG01759.1 HD-GYP domain, c-di-GMP phosphodiesterase class II (or its inactivated variant) [Caloramator fervidus]